MPHRRAVRLAAVGAAVAAAATASLVAATSSPGGALPAVASATLVDIHGNEVGDALFTARGDGSVTGKVVVSIDRSVTDPSGTGSEFHGMHLHANDDDDTGDGDPGDGCVTYPADATPPSSAWFTEVDGHWDLGGHAHGNHTGDLPSLMRQGDGEAVITFAVDKLTATQLPGRALVVHFAADDFGKHPSIGTSATTGNAGARYACGVVEATARHR